MPQAARFDNLKTWRLERHHRNVDSIGNQCTTGKGFKGKLYLVDYIK